MIFDKSTEPAPHEDGLLTHQHLVEQHHLAEFFGTDRPAVYLQGDLARLDRPAVYLQGDLARLELRLISTLQAWFINRDYEPFSNPDFCKSAVAEGCGSELESRSLFNLKPCQDFQVGLHGIRSQCRVSSLDTMGFKQVQSNPGMRIQNILFLGSG